MTPDITVIIVNFNSGPHLAECLNSLDAGLTGCNWEVVVVDNASTDSSEAAARRARRSIPERDECGSSDSRPTPASRPRRTWERERVRRTSCCSSTPIAWLPLDSLTPLLDELDTRPRCAAVAPCVLNEDGSPQGNARGDPTMMTGFFGRSTLLSRLFPSARLARRNVVMSHSQAAASVDWVSGSCVLVQREAFDEIGGFDERYFLYWEDADLCRRLRNAGWSIRFRPEARIVHVGGRSSRTVKPLAIRAFHRSAYLGTTRRTLRRHGGAHVDGWQRDSCSLVAASNFWRRVFAESSPPI